MREYGENGHLMLTEELVFGDVSYESGSMGEMIQKAYANGQSEKHIENYRKIVEFHDGNNGRQIYRNGKKGRDYLGRYIYILVVETEAEAFAGQISEIVEALGNNQIVDADFSCQFTPVRIINIVELIVHFNHFLPDYPVTGRQVVTGACDVAESVGIDGI